MPEDWKASPSHTAFRVKDMDKCVKFYTEVLGLPVTRVIGEPDNPRIVFLPGLELVQDDSLEREECRGLVHVGMKVDNPEVAVAELKAQGVKFQERAKPMPAFFEDPEGNVVEFV